VQKRKPELALLKHTQALKGTGFDRCARCCGTTGKVVNGFMGCSNAGPTVVYVTLIVARGCNGKNPLHLGDHVEVPHRISDIFTHPLQ
jgi:hypothetical protein